MYKTGFKTRHGHVIGIGKQEMKTLKIILESFEQLPVTVRRAIVRDAAVEVKRRPQSVVSAATKMIDSINAILPEL